MTELLNFVDNIRKMWEDWGVKINVKPIKNGFQLGVNYDGGDFNVRVFNNKITGVKLDWSQVKDPAAKTDLENMLENKYDPETKMYNLLNDECGLDIIGSDEAGKGDTFGGMVVAAAFVPNDIIPDLKKLGVTDSKKLSDDKMFDIVREIFVGSDAVDFISWAQDDPEDPDISLPIEIIGRSKYPISAAIVVANPTTDKPEDEVLRKMHIHAIKAAMNRAGFEGILPSEIAVVIDQFSYTEKEVGIMAANVYNACDEIFSEYYNDTHWKLHCGMHTKAESDTVAVALASIIARVSYITELEKLSELSGIRLTPGTNGDTVKKLRLLKDGGHNITKFAKGSFRNVKEVINS